MSRAIGSGTQTEALSVAIARAVLRRTSVHVALSSDIAAARLPTSADARIHAECLRPRVLVDAAALNEARARLAGAGTSAIVVGAVDDDVQAEVEALASAMGAPIFVLAEGLEHLRREPRELVVRVGSKGDDALSLIARADRVVVVGRTSPRVASLVAASRGGVVHVAPSHELALAARGCATRILGEPRAIVTALASRLERAADDGLYREARALGANAGSDRFVAGLWRALDRAIPNDATIALEPGDVLDGAFSQLAARGRRLTSSFQLGARGYALAGAVAGALARPDAASVAITSASGLAESMADLLTPRKYGLPVRIVALPTREPLFGAIDFGIFARTAGYRVHRVRAAEDLERALREDASSRMPSFIQVEADEARRSVPSVTSDAPALADGSLADTLIEALVAAGASRVFGRPHAVLAPFVERLRADGRIAFVPVSHSESASMMASAHAKWTRTLGVCIAGDASDLLTQLNGLYDAAFDRAPLLVLTPPAIGLVDPAELLSDVAVVRRRLTPDDACNALGETLREAHRQKGVTHLVVDWDALGAPAPKLPAWFVARAEPEVVAPDEALVHKAAAVLRAARRPAILVGRGGAEAVDAILALADRLEAPIVSTMPGRAVISDAHPRYVGAIGASGHLSAIGALEECDVLLSVGSSSRGAVYGFAGSFTMIQIDRDALQLGRRPYPTIGIDGSAKPTLEALAAALGDPPARNGHDPLAERRRFTIEKRRRFEAFCDENRALTASTVVPIRPPMICAALSKALGDLGKSATITVDVGVTTLWVYRHFIGGPHEIVWSSSFGTMGFSLPAAIAIRDAAPDRPVIAMTGDGGIGITMAELASAAARGVPAVAVVFNNGKLAAIKYEQEVMGWPEFESSLSNPDFAEYARACGAHGIRVTDPTKLEDALREALTCGRPCVVDVVCDPHELPAPPKIHARQAAGYFLAVSREGRPGIKELLLQAARLARIR